VKQYSFEKLKFWDDIRLLVKQIYLLTKSFPEDERYGLISQMRRSAISVSSNIAEGTSRTSLKYQAHFSQLSYSSLMELLSQSVLSFDLGFLKEHDYNELRLQIESLSRQINALRKSQLERSK
jgi:four helix bundle protein